jgi:hypothetical protein
MADVGTSIHTRIISGAKYITRLGRSFSLGPFCI